MTTLEKTIPQAIARPFFGVEIFRKVFTFPAFLGVLLLAGVFFSARVEGVSGSLLISEPDSWWHIRAGEQILETHRLATADTYSFTVHGQNWMDYEWLGEVIMAEAARLGSLAGLATLLLLLSGILMVLIYYYAYLFSKHWQASFVASAALLPFTNGFFTLRPQMIGYICLLITLICLERFRSGAQRNLWLLPPLFLFWVNVHGSFVLGFFALAAYWVGGLFKFDAGGVAGKPWLAGERKHILIVTLLSLIAVCVTPYGTAVAAYPLQITLMQPLNVGNIMEWMPLAFDVLGGKLLLLALLGVITGILILRPVFRLESVILFIPAIYEGMVHRRLGFFLLIILTPFISLMIQRWLPTYRPQEDRPILNAILILFFALLMIRLHPRTVDLEPRLAKKFPVGAVSYLRQHPELRTYNEYGWGGYLIWANPGERVFIDGRADIYEYAGVFQDYLDISDLAPGAFLWLTKYRVNACLLEPHSPLSTVLRAVPGWHSVYRDDISVVFVLNAK